MSKARVPVAVLAATLLVATALFAPTTALADGTDDLASLINALREQPQDCAGATATPPQPLAPSPELARANPPAHGGDLGRALVAAGYRAATATTITLSGASGAQRAAALLRSNYCSSLRDRRFSEIGIAHRGDTWRINLAQPLLPASLGAWREAAAIGAGSILGGYLGARALKVLPERVLKVGIVVIGVALTVALFLRG
jgi:hypothetical protein